MNKKLFFAVSGLAVALSVAAALGVFQENITKSPGRNREAAGLVVGRNAIYVPDQAPSQRIAIAVVYLERGGFVVIHEDNDGSPGSVLGVSGVLGDGETGNLSVALARPSRNDEALYAMLHLDDGDGAFDATEDAPAQNDVDGGPIMMMFVVHEDFTEPSDVQL